MGRLHEAAATEPDGEKVGPVLGAYILVGEADTVWTASEEVHLRGNLVGEERGVEHDGVLGGDDGIVGGGEEKGGRSARGDVLLGGEEFDLGGVGLIAEEV